MKAFGIALLALLGFGAYFTTFLVAPLAVLVIFYVLYSLASSRAERRPQALSHQLPWEPSPAPEPEPLHAPSRRTRITVVSRETAVDEHGATENGDPS